MSKDTITTVYSVCDDVLESLSYQNDPQFHCNDAEVRIIALTSALFYGSNSQSAWNVLFGLLAQVFMRCNAARGADSPLTFIRFWCAPTVASIVAASFSCVK